MMNTLDSRAIGLTDTYGQRFMRTGTYQYDVALAGCGGLSDAPPYVIGVGGGDADTMTQHTVMVTYEDRTFHPDQPKLKVAAGDLVTWACREPKAPAFEVIGEKDFFNSARLVNESGYAHAFGVAGEYHWVDAYGSGLSGVVRVHDPRARSRDELTEWRRSLAKGALVMIAGEDADPTEIDIMTGQTVYFAVTKGPGVSITDIRLAKAERAAIDAVDKIADYPNRDVKRKAE